MFNNDPQIDGSYSGESWTAEFMEYGCYCNKFVRGGGRVEAEDVHENLCLELYACYKCIGIDYDTGNGKIGKNYEFIGLNKTHNNTHSIEHP